MTSIYTDLEFPESDDGEDETVDIPSIPPRQFGSRGYNEERYQRHRAQSRAEAEATYQAHRIQAREEAAALKRQTQLDEALVSQPKPLPAPAAGNTPAAPAWASISRFLNPSDVQSLTSAWQGGSLGTGAVNPVALRRYMALLPIAATPYSFIVQLRNSWAAAAPTRTTTVRAPSVRNVSTPRPVRFSRNVVASVGEPQDIGLAAPGG